MLLRDILWHRKFDFPIKASRMRTRMINSIPICLVHTFAVSMATNVFMSLTLEVRFVSSSMLNEEI
jgi:hypothetical protein